MPELDQEISYFTGLDLGQQSDFTALVVLECRAPFEKIEGLRVVRPPVTFPAGTNTAIKPAVTQPTVQIKPGTPLTRTYAIRHIERFDLGTPYPNIVEWVGRKFEAPPLRGTTLAIDQTGVGRAVVDMFVKARPKARLQPITITGGTQTSVDEQGGWKVPKKELVSICQVLLQARRIKGAARLAHLTTLLRELEMFRVKITTSANETFEGWRSRDHDDLVLALALAAWSAERGRQEYWLR